MDNEIIKTALQNPEIMIDVIGSGYISGRKLEKLEIVYKQYLKNKQMPTPEMCASLFGVDINEVNETDRELVYQTLHEFNVIRYIDEVQGSLNMSAKGISVDEIQDIGKKHLKTYGSKEDDSFEVSSFEDIKKLRERINQKEENFLHSGYPSINALTEGKSGNGGWHPGAIYSIVGLSGYGKSIFLANFARDMWEQEKNVLYISTEMDQDETFERIIKSKYKVKSIDEAVLQAQSNIPKSKIKVIKVHPNDTTCDDVQRLIDSQDWKPDILFIDYADELKSHESSNNEYEAQGIVYAGLKKLAEVNKLPVITATQTNRGAEDGEKGGTKDYVGYNAVADSSKKIRLVDMLFSITQSSTEKGEGIINLFVLKNRFGESQKRISFSINYQTMRLEEIDKISTTIKKPKKDSTPKKEMYLAEKILMGEKL